MIKQFKYALLAGVIAVASVGCEDEFLTQANPNAITDMTYWQTSSDFEMAVNSLYGSLQLPAVSGGDFLSLEPLRTDFAGTESWFSTQVVFTKLNWNDATAYVASRWSELYVGVYRANQILYYVDGCDALTQEEKNLITAQAKFIRAYSYFFLAHGYDGAVIIDQMPVSADEMHNPFSTRQEVIDQMVIPDLEYAKSVLPETWSDAEKGRATWGAATAMLGKTYLYDKEWDKAAAEFKLVIDSEVYSLVSNFMDNFTVDNEFNSESIFEVSFSDTYKTGTNASQHDETDGSEATGIAAAFASGQGAGGWNSVLGSYPLQELYVAADVMDPANSWTSSHVRGMRAYATVAIEYADGDYYQAPLTPYVADDGSTVASKANFNYGQSCKIKKWTQWDRVSTEDATTGCRTGINYRAFRYADLLLMYAECMLNKGDVTTAIEYIDKVRTRAGVITLTQYMADNGGKIPQLHVSSYVNGRTDTGVYTSEYDYVTADANAVMTHLQRVERPLELAFEGHRWFDLVRWGIVKEVLDDCWDYEQKLISMLVVDGVIPGTATKEYPLYVNERVRPDFETASTNYVSSAHDYFPIPSVETQNNEAL